MSFALPPPDPVPIIGRASVIDGDTIEIHGKRIRLWGVDAPESRQTCTRARETYRCGQVSALHLAELIGEQPVTCTPEGRPDRYRRIVARCSVTALCEDSDCTDPTFRRELGGWMVASGWAVDYPQYSDGEHSEQQFDAQEARKGMWAGEFQMPWEWRATK
jgi:endonuclease YncB( thermonuclease family)